ncbi:hypothetical protein B0H19DRAFT_1277121 [Mycena capillaripes]|nr:hypothetical protein B0H19DRAFT_1277121 [Mycena capillaripes]
MATGIVHGAPAPDNGGSGLVISHIVPVGEYNMTYWVDAPAAGTVASRALSARACGTKDLVNSLNTGASIGNSPHSICLGQSNNQCCVSWSGPAGTMTESNLVNAANKIFGTYWSPTNGSGLARNVILNNICVTECLSNRPDGCS